MNKLVETDIGTIASNWKLCLLEELCDSPQYGYNASASDKGDARFLRITDITESGVKWTTVPYCECSKENLQKYLLRSGDIVFARIGSTTGKSYLILDPPLSVFASYLIRVRAEKEMDAVFLSHFFRSNGYWRQIDSQKDTNLKKGVNGSILKKLMVPVPPLPEQKKIAHILSTVQKAIEEQERIIQITIELKKALMQKLFTEGLRGEPQKEKEIGPVPESWEVVEFDSFNTLQRGKDLTRAQFQEGTIPVAGSNGIIGYHNKSIYNGPGVTVGRSGSVGKVTFYNECFWAHNTCLYVKNFHGNDVEFSAYYLEHLNLERFKTGASA